MGKGTASAVPPKFTRTFGFSNEVRFSSPRSGIIPTIMENLDPAGDYLRISEHYRRLSDGELLVLARQPCELTEIAQQALANEISHRGLKGQPEEPSPPPKVWPPPDTFDPNDPSYDEDRQLVTICTVWSLADALQVQSLLDTAGIPFFMGPERATGVDAVTSNLADGVGVAVMNVGIPWARQVMQNYTPANDQTPKEEKEPASKLSVRCPRCHSTEIVFEDMIPPTADPLLPQTYKWICDSCGHQWEDDGILREE
jgi:DNA-directed RNA polymerase subunit M/transcription elongation factor TFIIS